MSEVSIFVERTRERQSMRSKARRLTRRVTIVIIDATVAYERLIISQALSTQNAKSWGGTFGFWGRAVALDNSLVYMCWRI